MRKYNKLLIELRGGWSLETKNDLKIWKRCENSGNNDQCMKNYQEKPQWDS